MLQRLFALALLVGCQNEAGATRPLPTYATPLSAPETPANGDSALAPLPRAIELDRRKVALGARLFRDPRLSGDSKVACTDCHAFDLGGGNGEARSTLPAREPVAVNVPSVFNAAFNFRFGWGGGFEDLGAQLDFAMEAPAVMASSWPRAAAALARDARIVGEFAAIYPDGLSAPNLRDVLAIYSLSLITPDARFDRYLRGELALDAEELRGYELFRDHGCVSCHQGVNVGGNMVQRFGVMRDYFGARALQPADLGLFAFTARAEDRHVFRVPSLRNVARTAPYFHDASAATLEQATETMARYQLGRELDAEQTSQIVAFLRTLTGELGGRPL